MEKEKCCCVKARMRKGKRERKWIKETNMKVGESERKKEKE